MNQQHVKGDSNRDHALAYARRGWAVFPCANKKPLVERGFLCATTDEAQIRSWWERWPQAEIGVACGASGLAVVDLDVGKGKDGVASFHRLCDDHGRHGCGLVAITPRGGRHYIYLMPSPPIGCGVDVLPGSGIDVRADGGYVIVPSLDGGGGREWLEGDPLDPSDLCPMPAWTQATLAPRKRVAMSTGSAPGGDDGDTVPLLPAMRRLIESALPHIDCDPRETWIRVGMALRNTGAGDEAYQLWCEWSSKSPKYDEQVQRQQWQSLRQWRHDGREVGIRTLFWMAEQEGWTASVDEAVAAEAAEAAEDEVVTSEDRAVPIAGPEAAQLHPFPIHLLTECPGLLGDVARWALEHSAKRQPALVLGSTIATLGAVVGRRVATSTDLRTNFYILGIGETGCGKDASLKLPPQLLVAAGLHTLVGPSEWASAAGLRAALKHAPAHCCYIDEFAKLLSQMSGERTPAHLANIRRYMLECFSSAGSTWQAVAYADRKLHDHDPMSEPHLCVYGTGVPAEAFTAMGRAGVADGFFNRLLICWADEQLPKRNRIGRVVPPSGLVQRLQALEEATRPAGNLAGKSSAFGVETGCRTIHWAKGAEDAWERVRDNFESRMVMAREAGSDLADLWARSGEHVAKLALLRSVCDNPTRGIGIQDVDWATEFVQWTTQRTMHAAADRIAENNYERCLKFVRRTIREVGAEGVTSTDLLRKFTWMTSPEVAEALKRLEAQGEIESTKVTGRRGRPPVVYVAKSPA
jgi:hypothetical protein